MRYFLIALLLIFSSTLLGQTVGQLRYDTVKMHKEGGSTELVLRNKTRDSLGFLFNLGAGVTEFRRARQLNDSTIVIGRDTFTLRSSASGNNYPTSVTLAAGTLTINRNGLTAITAPASTTNITEGTNLYYTDARARASVSSANALLGYNNTSGVFTLNISAADTTYWGSKASGGDYLKGLTGDGFATAPVGGANNGIGLFVLANTTVVPGTYVNSTVTVDSKGRITDISSGAGGGSGTDNTNLGLGFKALNQTSQGIKTLFGTGSVTIDSSSNTNGLTFQVNPTWVGHTATTTVGTIGTGIWQGTAIADTYIASAATWNAKLSNALTNTNIFVGNASNIAIGVVMSGDATLANTGALTLATVNSNVGSFTNGSFTVDAKGRITAASSGTSPPIDAVPTDGSTNAVQSNGVFDALALKAPLASPGLTGVPTAPTAAPGTNTTQIASTAFVQAAVTAATTGVISFNGRTGIVVPVTNDYTWAQLNKTTSSLADITTRSAGDLSSGTLLDVRLSANVPLKNTANTFTQDQSVPDHAFGITWDGSLEVPTKNALYDIINTLGGASYTDEDAQDAVGAMVSSEFTYVDVTPTLSINAIAASKITQSSSFRFVTDAEKATWNAKVTSITGTANRIVISGSVTVPIVDIGTDVVTLTGSQTLSNKTLTSPLINFGSDANGDIMVRVGGAYTRFPAGAGGKVLKIVSGVPSWEDDQTGSGGLSDGDKGDITISGLLTAFNIDNLAVTNAKINDVAWTKITGVPDGVADGSTKGIMSGIAADFNATAGVFSIDYTNAQSATSGQKGFLTAADWTTFNNKQNAITLGTTAQYFRGDLSLATFPTFSGSNTGDVTLTGENYLSIAGQVITANAVNLSNTNATGTLAAARLGTFTGDVTNVGYANTIANDAVTFAKFQNINSQRLLGRFAGTSGDMQEIILGANLTLNSSTGELDASGGGGGGGVNSGIINTLAYYPGTGTTVDDIAAITANRALISDANGLPSHSVTTNTELSYVNGVTSSIQVQLDAKQWIVAAVSEAASGAANTSAIHAAISTAFSQRKRVLILGGTYDVTNITLNPAVPMDGAGMYRTILVATTSGDMFSYTSSTRVPFTEITNMMLEGDAVGTNAINLHSSSQVKISDVFISNFTGIGINFKGVLISEVTRCIIQLVVTGVKGEGDIALANLANLMTFNAVKFYDITGWGVDWTQGASIKFNDCDFERCGHPSAGTGGAIYGHGLSASGPGALSEGMDITINGGWAEINYGEAVIKLENNNGMTVLRDFLIHNYTGNSAYGIINDNSKLYLENVKIGDFPTNAILTRDAGETTVAYVSDIFEHTEATGGSYLVLPGTSGGGSGDMLTTAVNTMTSTGEIIFPTSSVTANLRVGKFEFQSRAINEGYWFENMYFNGTDYKYRGTGFGSLWYYGNGSAAFFHFPNGAAGATGTAVERFTIAQTGDIKIATAGAYLNFNATGGTGGYGFRDNGGVMEWKNSGGSWAAFGSGGSSQWTTAGSDIYFSGGNVGIGSNTTPDYILDIVKNQNAATTLNIQNTTAGASAIASVLIQSDAGYMDFGMYSSTTSAFGAIASGNAYISSNQPLTIMTPGASDYINFAVGGSAESFRFVNASGINYFNFAGGSGTSGYGIRDNAGTPEWKASGGSWAGFGGGGGGDMFLANDNLLTGSGKIRLPTSAATTNLRVGTFAVQGRNTNESYVFENMYYDGADYRFMATGTGTLLYMGAGNLYMFNATAGSAGNVATTVERFALTANGDIKISTAGAFLTWGATSGTSGYGFWDDAGTMKWKNSGGSWTTFNSGDMFLNATNTMGASSRIEFTNTNSANTSIQVGALGLQTLGTLSSHMLFNAYYDAGTPKFIVNGTAGMLSWGADQININLSSASGTAGGTVTWNMILSHVPTGSIYKQANAYVNFGGSAGGSTGYGFRDNAGVMEWKSSGGSWATFGSGGSESTTASGGLTLSGVDVRLGGTLLAGTTEILGGGTSSLNLGNSGSKLANFAMISSGTATIDALYLHVVTGIRYKYNLATDANFTVTQQMTLIVLPTITANRTLTLPSNNQGQEYIIINKNSSAFSWNISDSRLKDAADNTISSLVNDAAYNLMDDGTNFYKTN